MPHLDWLLETFDRNAEQAFMIHGDRPIPYSWLLGNVRQCAARLDECGLKGGTIAALRGDYSPGIVAALLALVDRGSVVVPLSPAAAAHEADYMDIAEVQAVWSFGADAGGAPVKRAVTPSHPLFEELVRRGHPGLVLFSSGSTGKSKAALHDFTCLLEKFKTRRRGMVTLTFLMIDHIGGINTLLHVLSNAGTVVVSPSRDPHVVCATIAAQKVELLPTSPTFLNLLVLSEAYKHHDLSSLKLITYGTEMMPRQTLERISELLPHVTLQQTYGLSEVGILRSKSERSNSLWVRVGGEGYETKVAGGTLWIKAHSAMMGYLNAPSPFDADGWLDTGDMVEVQGEYVRFLGRSTEIINVGGNKVYPAEVENVLMEIPNVRDVTVFSSRNPITGNIVVAHFNLIEPEDFGSFKKRVREFCRGRLEPFKVPARMQVVQNDQFSGRFKKVRCKTE